MENAENACLHVQFAMEINQQFAITVMKDSYTLLKLEPSELTVINAMMKIVKNVQAEMFVPLA